MLFMPTTRLVAFLLTAARPFGLLLALTRRLRSHYLRVCVWGGGGMCMDGCVRGCVHGCVRGCVRARVHV